MGRGLTGWLRRGRCATAANETQHASLDAVALLRSEEYLAAPAGVGELPLSNACALLQYLEPEVRLYTGLFGKFLEQVDRLVWPGIGVFVK